VTGHKTPSLKDVALAAGVSVTTISRFLNGSLELPSETKTRIEQAILTLDYRPNPHARRLSRGRSDTIGLVVPDIANPFFGTLVAAVEQAADERKLAVSLHATLNRAGREVEYLRLIERNHVDGLIFVTNHADDGTLAALINRTGKVIVVDEDVPGSKAPKLFGDNRLGGYLVGRHLAEQGHKHVAFIGGDERMISTRRRFDGLVGGLREQYGAQARVDRYAGEYTLDYGRKAALEYLEGGRLATAVFASSDEIAIGLVEVFKERGVSIPDDVSVVGFDDVGPLHLFSPALTAVRQPVRRMGQRSLEMLLETNWQEWKPSATEELLPLEIVVRNSVAPPAKQKNATANRKRNGT
jgi:LacI family transcriptional regulator